MTTASMHLKYPIDGRSDRIMAAALAEFGRRGFRAARVHVIARRAGVSITTLTRYFPVKEELFREVVRSAIVTRLQEPIAGSLPDQTAAGRFRAFVRNFWRSLDGPDQAALLRLSLAELPNFPELALFHTTEVLGRAVRCLERILVEGIASGELVVADPRATARTVLSAVVTHSLWFALPELYGSLTGPDRGRAESAVLDVLSGLIGPRVSAPAAEPREEHPLA